MNKILIGLMVALLLGIGGPANAQPRDGFMNESRQESDAAACRSDPRCIDLLRKTEARETREAAEFDALPLHEKFLRWALGLVFVGAVIAAVTYLFGGGKKGRDSRR